MRNITINRRLQSTVTWETGKEKAKTSTYLGRLARDQERYHEAEQFLLQSLDIRREVMDYRGVGIVLSALGQTASRAERYEFGWDCSAKLLNTFREVQDAINCALVSLELGSLLVQRRNKREEGQVLLQEAIAVRGQYNLPGIAEARSVAEQLGVEGSHNQQPGPNSNS